MNSNTINAALNGIRGDLTIPVTALNRTQGFVVAANGVVNMQKKRADGALDVLPFSQTMLETRCSPCNYRPELYRVRQPETWHPAVRSLMGAVDSKARLWLLEQGGKALSGIFAKLDFLTYLSGRAGAGKSSFLKALRIVGGDYAGFIDRKAFRNNSGTNFSLAAYEYVRMAFVEELPEDFINVDSVKDLVNASQLTIEKKFEQPRVIPMEAHTFITANVLPRVRQNDEGLWRRQRALAFTKIFVETQQELEAGGVKPWKQRVVVLGVGVGRTRVG